jgi:hypothetical protein
MQRFLILAAVGVLALVVQGDSASAQNRGGFAQVPPEGRLGHVKGRALPRGLKGRTLPRNYARFSRTRYSARYDCLLYRARTTWYYWYDPFQRFLPVAVIATYPPTVIATTPDVAPPYGRPAYSMPPISVAPATRPMGPPPGSMPPPSVAPATRPVGPTG